MRSAYQSSKERAGRVPAAGSAGGQIAEAPGEQGVLVGAAWPGDEHRGPALASEPAGITAARCPDVEDAVANPASRVVDQEAAVVLPTDVQLHIAAEREELRIRGDDTFADETIAARRSLETVRGELHRHRLAHTGRPLRDDRPVARHATHE